MEHGLPVNPEASMDRQRIDLLQIGDEEGWWQYKSANRPGYVDSRGHTYAERTYTIKIPPPPDPEREPDGDEVALRERVLVAGEVHGYVLATADRYPGAVELIAYRQTLLPIE
jgi:hypothetical protein